jgi:murein L,D-transpeptidase YcbB/YkuD
MIHRYSCYSFRLFLVVLLTGAITGCHDKKKPREKDVVATPKQLKERVRENLEELLNYTADNNGKLNDSLQLKIWPLIQKIYEAGDYQINWSNEDQWKPAADSMFQFLSDVSLYGLFPSDYPVTELTVIQNKITSDSFSRKDAVLWARAEVLLTESYLSIARDLKLGRLERDSLALINDSLFTDDYFINHFNKAIASSQILSSLQELEPHHAGYAAIKAGIKNWLRNDSLLYHFYDSALQQFRQIAITLDRYKLLPDTLPSTYAWVNIPAYTLSIYDADTLVFDSKVIVGAPKTRTPELSSAITNFITYPQWTVPYSIIFKEMLPKIRKDISYLQKQNLMVVDKNDNVIDPHTIDWMKMSKNHFPYLLKQRQGDDNSLGVLKFNFRNKYNVYLHDTNARGLFSKSNRALSHGCVRLQKWQDLAHFLVRNDTLRYSSDTLNAWIQRQEKHLVSGFPRLPIYIRYFTVEGTKDSTLLFNRDIYKEDSVLAAGYFAGKKL